MSLFPWDNLWEMAAWFALFAGLWHYSDQLAISLMERGYLRRKAAWMWLAALSIGLGMFPIIYLGAELLLTEAVNVAGANMPFQGKIISAAVMAFSIVLLISMGRYIKLQEGILYQLILPHWDFDYEDLLSQKTWNVQTVSELNDLNLRLGIGRLAVAALNSSGHVVTLAVRRTNRLRLDPIERFALTYWARLEGSHSLSIWYCADAERPPLESEYTEIETILKVFTENGVEMQSVLFHDGNQIACLHAASSFQPSLRAESDLPLWKAESTGQRA
ncbi:hypothetical protein H1S01_14670 [Heliobacterium chlorum]|uniref:Uncharacterized protein n=1 Tax=Heliobacterium chlorum TaxID=2698 RepID=A0ABR7T4M6_HELCL|nr:hypothetical protein [Heliobacterium chlorum]MBC9785733.1 hypothetical protein [Heliobacterium chlorum]